MSVHSNRSASAVALAVGVLTALDPAPLGGAAPSPCDTTGVERIVAVGDVHGAYDRLVDILRVTGLVDARLRWSGGRTRLVQLGDIVDRGPDSRKALDLLQRLEKEAAGAGGGVHVLLGNHEVMRILGDLRFVTPGEYEAFVTSDSEATRQKVVQAAAPADRDALIKELPLGAVEMRVAFGPQGAYGKWLRTRNVVMKINDVLFLHGGISPAVASLSCTVVNETVRRELTTDFVKTQAAPLASLVAREDGPLWYRGFAQESETFTSQVDAILSQQHARMLVVAHTVATDGRIQLRFGGKVLQIDTGMQSGYVPTGRASALEIEHGVFTAVYQDRRDILVGKGAEVVAP